MTFQTLYTVKHFLIKCGDLVEIGQRFVNTLNMKERFENVNMEAILSFLREIELYQTLEI